MLNLLTAEITRQGVEGCEPPLDLPLEDSPLVKSIKIIKLITYIRDLFHVFLNKVKIIVRFLVYKLGIKVLLDIML